MSMSKEEMQKSYNRGMIDGIKLWGDVCQVMENCDRCPIALIAGANVTCAQFASKFPEKTCSLMKEMREKDHTYFDEYVTRFPNCNMNVEDLSFCACRKAIFEGFTGCDNEDQDECIRCWKQTYGGDVTVDPSEYEQEEADEVIENDDEPLSEEEFDSLF